MLLSHWSVLLLPLGSNLILACNLHQAIAPLRIRWFLTNELVAANLIFIPARSPLIGLMLEGPPGTVCILSQPTRPGRNVLKIRYSHSTMGAKQLIVDSTCFALYCSKLTGTTYSPTLVLAHAQQLAVDR